MKLTLIMLFTIAAALIILGLQDEDLREENKILKSELSSAKSGQKEIIKEWMTDDSLNESINAKKRIIIFELGVEYGFIETGLAGATNFNDCLEKTKVLVKQAGQQEMIYGKD